MTIQEKDVFCFKASLQHVGKETTFEVPFQVIASDKFEAKSILEQWLSNPEQTGYKFEQCVGLICKPSTSVLVAASKPIYGRQCKVCVHWDVCATVMQHQLLIKEKVCGQKDPACPHFLQKVEVKI